MFSAFSAVNLLFNSKRESLMSEKIKLSINGQEVYTGPQQTILQAVQEQGLDEIPTLCYDPKLPPYGACFLCVVEVEGRRNLVPSCSTRAEAGMVVQTHSEK